MAVGSSYADYIMTQFLIGVPAGAAELLANQNIETWTDAQELLTDPGFEDWDDANTPTNWTPSSSGDSSVNRDTASKHSGTYCARLDIDDSDNNAQIAQAFSIESGVSCTFSFYHEETGSATAKYSIVNDTGDYLQADLTWDTEYWFETGNESSYLIETVAFVPEETSAHVFTIKEGSNVTEESIYLDDASLQLTHGLVVDGGFEAWDDANTLTEWTKYVAGGTSNLVRSEDEHEGTYAATLVIDGGGNSTAIYQGLEVVSGETYELSFYHKETNAATLGVRLWDIEAAPDEFLQDDGTWTTDSNYFYRDHADSYTTDSIKFVANTTGTLNVHFIGEDASETYYIDKVVLKPIPTPDDWTVVPSKFSMIERDYDGQSGAAVRVDSDAGGILAYLFQAASLVAGVTYGFTIYGKAEAGADPNMRIRNTSGGSENNYYLQADGSWAAGLATFTWTDTGYTLKTVYFTPAESGDHSIYLINVTSNKSYYYDTLSLKSTVGGETGPWLGSVTGNNFKLFVQHIRIVDSDWASALLDVWDADWTAEIALANIATAFANA